MTARRCVRSPHGQADSPLGEVLATMQAGGSPMGQVVDEAGAAVGVLALEDVLEELVGEVRDAAASGRAPRDERPRRVGGVRVR